MTEIKAFVVSFFCGVFTLLAPIHNFMYAMLFIFSLNFIAGFTADWIDIKRKDPDVNPWNNKKALMFFVCCAFFFVIAASAFIVGYLMGEQEQAKAVVQYMCWIAIVIFAINIFRNLRKVAQKGTSWYRFFDICYYVLSVQFIEKLPFVKKYLDENKEEYENRPA